MNCPTCNEEMGLVEIRHWWCSRCGTIKNDFYEGAPGLVYLCRAFETGSLHLGGLQEETWDQLIADAIGTDKSKRPRKIPPDEDVP